MRLQTDEFLRGSAVAWLLVTAYTFSQAGELADYEAIIQKARSGGYAEAAMALERWSAAEPAQSRVNSDLTVILSQAGRSKDALALAKRLGVAALEPYAIRSAAVAARNLQDAPWAVAAYERLLELDAADCDARLGLALSLVDAGENTRSGAMLDMLEQQCTPPGGQYIRAIAQARTYWAARRSDVRFPQELLALGWWSEQLNSVGDLGRPSRRLDPNYQPEALREAVNVASRNGAHHLVRRWLERQPGDLTNEETAQLLAAKAAQQIRWAIATPDEARANWRTLLNAALAYLERAKTLTQQPDLLSSIASDTVAAYSELGDDASTLKQVELADKAAYTLLPYAEVAAADALMRANQPRAAELRLRAAMLRLQGSNEFEQREVSAALFYALVDQGKFAEAQRWIDARAALVPTFSNRGLAGVQVEDDGYVRFQLTRSTLLSPALDGKGFNQSRSRVSTLLRDAPFNADVRLSDAEWLQARGWSRSAQDRVQMVLTDQPDNTRAMNVAARYALERGDFAGFRTYQSNIQTLGAHPQMLGRLQDAADRQTGFVLAGEALRGKGEASDPSSGSLDNEAALSLMSPIYQDRWRLKARWRSSDAEFGNAAPAAQFFAVGTRFYWPYAWAELEAVKRTDSSQSPGLRATGQWQLADGVSAFATLASRSEDLPLRGQAEGLSATSAQLAFDWRVLPQTYVGVNINGFNATDGNQQRGASAYADQGFTLADFWRANLRLDLSRATNSRSDVAYFSPSAINAYALTGAVAHDLVVAGQTGWTHKLALSAGEVGQQGFARANSYSAMYEHEWRLGSYRTLTAAIGQSRRPYDGVQSRRKTFSLRWSLAL